MTTLIHPTAIVDPGAILGDDVEIGPFAIIGPEVAIGDGCRIGPRAIVRWTRMGKGCFVGANSIVGGDPQFYNWKQVPSWVELGDNVFINELVAIHRAGYEGKSTRIGDKCYIMTQSHIAHDCVIGREVTITTLAGLSGHIEVGDYAVIGGSAGLHQHVRVGTMAMVGGMTRIVQDVPPCFMVVGNPSRPEGLNTVGMKRRGVGPDDRLRMKTAYKILVQSGLPPKEAVARIEVELELVGMVKNLVDFAKVESKRGLAV
ncbi:MAG: acyl-ACP--UDP-N-acetylglucosamine O-acyltransferase [Nitrospinae bacterium]|nr:acyl-ACP--UDP-N-acetylglucosamine O-acyltransferase [Nitrospinota bacterium]